MGKIGFKMKGAKYEANNDYTKQDLLWIATCLDMLIRSHRHELTKKDVPASDKIEARKSLKELESAYLKTQNKLIEIKN